MSEPHLTLKEDIMDIESVTRMSRDIRAAATTLSADEARFLVDSYYQQQENRIRSSHQVRTLSEGGEPHSVLSWLASNSDTLETQIAGALDRYSAHHPVGAWMRSQKGVGPVIAAGLLAHIDITKAITAGHIWNFAGLNPEIVWRKGEKRPFNAALKTLCWKLGESFVKVSGYEDAFYGQLYKQRKALETERNLRGEFAEQAALALTKKQIGKTTDAYAWYAGRLTREQAVKLLDDNSAGKAAKQGGEPGSGQAMLPPAHIHARAKRAAVKLFLAHMHEVWFEIENGRKPARPYALEHLGHAHQIAVPNWPMVEGVA
jgi:hypothetical protein